MLDRFLRHAAKVGLVLAGICLLYLIYFSVRRIQQMNRESYNLTEAMQKLQGVTGSTAPDLMPPRKESAQVSGRVLQAWKDVPSLPLLHGYDMYPLDGV